MEQKPKPILIGTVSIPLDATEEEMEEWEKKSIENIKKQEDEAKQSGRHEEFKEALKRQLGHESFYRVISRLIDLNIDYWKYY